MMDEGRIIACGTFEHLIAENDAFRTLMASADTDGQARSEDQDDNKAEEVPYRQQTKVAQSSLM